MIQRRILYSHLCAFDLDHTLIRENSSFQFFRFLMRVGLFSKFFIFSSSLLYLRHHFLNLSLSQLHEIVFKKFLFGRSLDVLEQYIEEYLNGEFVKSLYSPAIEHLRRAQHLGHYTVILSNSPAFLMKHITGYLGVDEYHASQYGLDQKGNLSRVISIVEGKQKVAYLQKLKDRFNLKENDITAYSDSHLDYPLLKFAGKAFIVNPNKKLTKLSKQHSWEIL